MGKLYDKRDFEWNVDYWTKMEQRMHARIASGETPASVLNEIFTYPASDNRPAQHVKWRDLFDHERQRERLKLLRTGTLLRELERWRKLFLACKDCYSTVKNGKNRDVACEEHKYGLGAAKGAVYWAGENNISERAARGQIREPDARTSKEATEGLETPLPTDPNEPKNGLNEWEQMHAREKATGTWPKDATFYDVAPTYKGFLQVLLQEGEMSEGQYLQECQRLREQEVDMVLSAKAIAGTNMKPRRDAHLPTTQSGYTTLT